MLWGFPRLGEGYADADQSATHPGLWGHVWRDPLFALLRDGESALGVDGDRLCHYRDRGGDLCQQWDEVSPQNLGRTPHPHRATCGGYLPTALAIESGGGHLDAVAGGSLWFACPAVAYPLTGQGPESEPKTEPKIAATANGCRQTHGNHRTVLQDIGQLCKSHPDYFLFALEDMHVIFNTGKSSML